MTAIVRRPARAGGSRDSVRLLVAALLLLNGLYAFNQMLVVPVLPTIERDLQTSTTRVTWLLSFFLMVSCVATPIIGKLSDQFGRRRLLLAVLATFFAGNVAAVLAPNIWVLIGARGLQGASGALTPIAIGLLSDILPREALHRALGGIMSAAMTGSGVGAAVSGLVVDHLSWRYLFAISGAVVLGCALVVARTTPADARRSAAPVDVRGAAMLVASLVTLLLALTEGDTWGWTSAPVLGLFAASAASFAVWLAYERRIPWPLVDVRVLGRRTVLVANVAQAVNSLAMASAIILVPRLVGMSPEIPGRPDLDPATGSEQPRPWWVSTCCRSRCRASSRATSPGGSGGGWASAARCSSAS